MSQLAAQVRRENVDPFDIFIDPAYCIRVESEYSVEGVAEIAKHIDDAGQLIAVKVRPATGLELRLTGCHYVMPHDKLSLTDGARRVLAVRDLLRDQDKLGITRSKTIVADVYYPGQ